MGWNGIKIHKYIISKKLFSQEFDSNKIKRKLNKTLKQYSLDVFFHII